MPRTTSDRDSNPEGRVDLHLHTHVSDGLLAPRDVVARARAHGIGTISITDHDTMGGVAEAMDAGRDLDVHVIPGVELSANRDGRELHMLAYFPTPDVPKLTALLDTVVTKRRERLCAMIDSLNEQGLRLDPDSILPDSGTAPARPHLARALIENGYASSIKDVYSRFIGPHCEAYAPKPVLEIEDAAALVHEYDGVAILAHPGKRYSEAQLVEMMCRGVDGIEVYHAKQARSTTKKLRGIAMANGMLITGGSDFHSPAYGPEVGESTLPAHDLEARLDRLGVAAQTSSIRPTPPASVPVSAEARSK